jgi:hypothetical protein
LRHKWSLDRAIWNDCKAPIPTAKAGIPAARKRTLQK